MRRTPLVLALLTLALVVQAAPVGARPLGGAVDLAGTLNGAAYEIRVPENWNGTLLVYARGYRDKADHPGEVDDLSADAAPGGDPMEEFLLLQGYALAGSAYRDNGWAVKEGIQNTLALTNFFKGRVGNPEHTILWGFSMGSVVTFESIEKYPGVYDAAIAGCAVGAGSTRSWDGAGAIALAYDVAFGWPASWGSPGNVRDDLDFETEVVPVLLAQVNDPANFGRFEFIRLVTGLPFEEFYDGSNWLFTDMFFVTEARAELERRAKGPVVQNLDHVYTLSAADKAHLASLGVGADPLLAAMNAGTTISAPRSARHYVERYADYTGNIKRPVLTIHTIGDGLVPVANEAAYRDTVDAAGKLDLLVQVYTDAVGHCDFTGEQLAAAVTAMSFWLDSGSPPGPAFFPEALGFLPSFEPPAWPQP